TIHDDRGEPLIIPRAICMHEEDYSILWKHWDFIDDHTQVRRQRRLALSFIGTNLNYEYGYYWYFYLDGTLELEVKLTGVMQTKALGEGAEDPYSSVVARGLVAMSPQLTFTARPEMDIDGTPNTVYEMDLARAPAGPANPWGNAMVVHSTPLVSESAARRCSDSAAGRTWVVMSSERRNRLGQPTGYRLIPQASPLLLAGPPPPPRKTTR